MQPKHEPAHRCSTCMFRHVWFAVQVGELQFCTRRQSVLQKHVPQIGVPQLSPAVLRAQPAVSVLVYAAPALHALPPHVKSWHCCVRDPLLLHALGYEHVVNAPQLVPAPQIRPSWVRAQPAVSVSVKLLPLHEPPPQVNAVHVRVLEPPFEHSPAYEHAPKLPHVCVLHVVPSWFRAQPAVSVSVVVVVSHAPIRHVKSVRPREREPPFEHAAAYEHAEYAPNCVVPQPRPSIAFAPSTQT